MHRSLEMTITEVIADAKSTGRMLRVAPLAEQLAAEFNQDPLTIARRITNLGLLSRISMEIDEPSDSPMAMPSHEVPSVDAHTSRVLECAQDWIRTQSAS
jgi:hypothetical protein